MFFSRVRIAPGSLAQIKLLRILQGDVYATHQLIWKLFPSILSGKRPFLFRQEFEKEQIANSDIRRGMPIYYIVSTVKPVAVDGLLMVETKNYTPQLYEGMRLGFDVRVNPVVQKKIERDNVEEWRQNRIKNGLKDKEPTKRRIYHDVLMHAKHQARTEGLNPQKQADRQIIKNRMDIAVKSWLIDSCTRYGFNIESTSLIEANAYQQNLLRKRGQKETKFSSIDLTGILTITDPTQFLTILEKGIGHSRSFGCGLMLVKKV